MTGLHWKSERRAGGHPPYYWGTGYVSERHERGKIFQRDGFFKEPSLFVSTHNRRSDDGLKSIAQPIRRSTPPMGVIAPSQRMFVTART